MAKNDANPTVENATSTRPLTKPRETNPVTGESATVVPGLGVTAESGTSIPGMPTRQSQQSTNASLVKNYQSKIPADTPPDTQTPPQQRTSSPFSTPQVNSTDNTPYTPTSTFYTPMAGWDAGKLRNANVTDQKYSFGRAIQDFGHLDRGNLQSLVDYYNNTYHPAQNAVVTGGDTVSFPGYANVDVIHGGDNAPQWLVI